MRLTASGAERTRRPALRRASVAGAMHTGVGSHPASAATFEAGTDTDATLIDV